MRIGIVAEQLRQQVPGGIGTYVRGLVGGLVALDDPALTLELVASAGPTPDPLAQLGPSLVQSRLGHRAQMAAWSMGFGAARSQHLDLLHLTSLAGPMRGSQRRTVMVHDLSWRRYPELTTRRGARWHEAAFGRAVASSARLIVPSVPVLEDVLDAGVDRARVTVIGEGSDHLGPPDQDASNKVLEALGIAGQYLLTVSTLEPRKNLNALCDARQEAIDEGAPPWPLLVAGPQGWGPEIPDRPGVHLLGPVDSATLAGLYAGCGAFVYVPIAEGFGLPPLEAMALGAPVVASSATPSMIDAPVLASCEASDRRSIREALGVALGADASAGELRDLGVAYAQRHRWVDVAAEHLTLWRQDA